MNIIEGDRLRAIKHILKFQPVVTVVIIILGILVALLEGIGLSFIVPIIDFAQQSGGTEDADGLVGVFACVYEGIGVPFTLETVVVGVVSVMTVRYAASFAIAWLRAQLQLSYEQELKQEAFNRTLAAEIGYFDREGSDDILNAIITQSKAAGTTVTRLVRFFEQIALVCVYVSIAMFVSVPITVGTIAVLGVFTYVVRYVIEPAYTVGDRVAEANERIQEHVQAGTQGIRDVKLFGLTDEVYEGFDSWLEQYVDSSIRIARNRAAVNKFYNFITAVTIFVIIYVVLTFTSLSLGELGIFLFAMFRLAPRVSMMNDVVYSIEANLPHLVRTQQFIDEIDEEKEYQEGSKEVPKISEIAFDDVSFAYGTDEQTLTKVSFTVDRGDFVAFIGKSGAGKSTVTALLSRMYTPDEGEITANGIDIREFDLKKWRANIAVVRQNPYLFNETLRYNLTVGNPDATDKQIDEVCRIAQVDEFLDNLSDGCETIIGDDGVKLSGGQRQRVAIARALLKDAQILILDEATSDLDTTIENQVQDAIELMDKDYITITIAHRLSTVSNADRIHTLQSGQIAETGTHDELIEADGKYAELYTAQSG